MHIKILHTTERASCSINGPSWIRGAGFAAPPQRLFKPTGFLYFLTDSHLAVVPCGVLVGRTTSNVTLAVRL